MRIPSGSTDRYVYFVALDATDLKTRETGLSSFTVRRSRNGGASAAFTTPTINETDVTNMPGVYELLLDEDTTLDSGHDTEELCLHITHAGMAPVTRTIELYRPEGTEGHTIDVSSGGEVGLDWANIGSPTTAVNLSGTTVKTATDVETDTADIQSRLPAALVSGRMDASVGAMASGVLTATAIAADAFTAAKFAADVTTEFQSGLATAASIAALNNLSAAQVNAEVDTALADIHLDHLIASADPGSVVADSSFLAKLVSKSATPSFASYSNQTDSLEALRDRGDAAWTTATGFSTHSAADVWAVGTRTITGLTAAALADFFDTDSGTTYGSAVAGSVVKEIADNAGGSALTVQAIVDGVWDEPMASHLDSGSTGAALNGAGSAGDPWGTTLPGAYGVGTAGKIVGDNLNATVSSRATQASVDTIDGIVDSILLDTGTDGVVVASINNNAITANAIATGAITAAKIANDAIGAAEIAADAIAAIQSGLATAAALTTVAGYVDTEVAAIKAVTDKLDTALELDGSVYRYTTNALEQAPSAGGSTDWTADERTAIRTILGVPASGTTPEEPTAGALKVIDDLIDTEVGTILAAVDTEVAAIKAKTDLIPAAPAAVGDIPTVAAISDGVWDELLSGHVIGGSAGAALAAAGTAGDPWITELPGSYEEGTAGYLLGTYLDAAVSSIVAVDPEAVAAAVLAYDAADLTEGSMPENSLYTIIQATVNWRVIGSNLVIYQTDGSTVHATIPLQTTDPDDVDLVTGAG